MAYSFMVGVVLALGQASEDQPQTADAIARAALELASEALIAEPPRPREALRELKRVEQLEPDNPWLWFYRGLAEGSLGNIAGEGRALRGD